MRNPYLAAFFRFLVCVLIAAPFVIAYYLLTRPMAVRTALPWQAVIAMHEFYQDSAPLPDYMHCISVKVTESEFKSFVTQMELVPYRGRESFPSCETNWWKASDGSSGAFYNPRKKGENARAMAKFENGTLYYVDIDY